MTTPENKPRQPQGHPVLGSGEVRHLRGVLMNLLDDLLLHDGFGHIGIDMKILKKGQKEVLIRCGKEYRFVVNFNHPGSGKG